MCNILSVQFWQTETPINAAPVSFMCTRRQSCAKGKWPKTDLQGRCLLLTLVKTDSARLKSKLDTSGGGAIHPTGGHSHNQQATAQETKR